jgi:acetyltransferase
VFRSVKPLLLPESVAIVGASEAGGYGWPKSIYENLEHAGFPAKIYLINPRREELWGRKVYPDFGALPEPVDLALAIVPAEIIADVLADGARHGLKTALVYASRFGEGDDADGKRRSAALKAVCDEHGLTVCGPNCMGAVSLPKNLLFYPSPRVRGLPRGPAGVVFQSGGTFMFWLAQAGKRGLGFTYAVSSGNELNLDLADYINFMVEDDDTKLIVSMIEGIRRPEAFMAAAEKALAAQKPILMVKIGSSERGRSAMLSHTGALAGDDDVFNAVCEKYGIIRCGSLDDLLETALAFQAGRVPTGSRVAMVGYSGGGKGLFLDHAADEGVEIAAFSPATADAIRPFIDEGVPSENPLDCGAGIAPRQKDFSTVCQLALADDGVDIAAVQGQLPQIPSDPDDPTVFSDMVAATGKPVIGFGRMSQNVSEEGCAFQTAAQIPFLQGLPETVRAIKGLVAYGVRLRSGVAPLPAPGGNESDLHGAAFDELLASRGLTPPKSAFAETPEAAAAEAADIGFPVALKIVSSRFTHKTEIGGVTLGLDDGESVADAGLAMAKRLFAVDAAAPIEGYLVQEMVAGVEFIIGVREDAQFGPFMVAGLGGILVEAMKDVSIRMLPLTPEAARGMLDELRGKAVLGAFRGSPPRDVDALIGAMCGLSAVFLDHRTWLSDLEVNPLIVLGEGAGVRAVDVRPVAKG